MSVHGGVATDALRWASGSQAFELGSAHAAVMARARDVFRPWLAPGAGPVARQWTIEADDTSGRWVARAPGVPEPLVRSSAARIVTAVEYQAVVAVTSSPADVVTFHGALVSRGGAGVLILGAPESGKSTLATALWLRGYAFAGDDTAVVDPVTGAAESVARRVSLRATSRALLGGHLWDRVTATPASELTAEGVLFHPSDVDGQPRVTVPVRACVFLGRVPPRADAVARHMNPASAVLALLPFANLSRRYDAGTVIERLAPFAARVTAFDLPRAALDAMVRAIDQVLDRAAA